MNIDVNSLRPRSSSRNVVNRIVSYYARPRSANMGGVNKAGQEWMLHLAEAGFSVTIVQAKGGYDRQLVSHPRIQFRLLKHWGKGRMTMRPRKLASVISAGDLVYLHEGWTPSNLLVAWYCVRKGITFVVMPHGVYDKQWVASLKSFPFRHRLERWLLDHALAIHIFLPGEASSLRRLAPHSRVVVALTGAQPDRQSWSVDAARGYLAWLGRYSVQNKGIDQLFEALTLIPPNERPRVQMRGQDYCGGKAEAIQLRDELNLQRWVNVGPELQRKQINDFLLHSRAFIHVPRWESVGLTILESLALGVPIVLGDGAQISKELGRSGAAVIVSSTNPSSIAEALHELPGDEHGQRGRRWLSENADWQTNTASLVRQLNIRPLGD